jgi:hypothetical protein
MSAMLTMPRPTTTTLRMERRLFPRKEVHAWVEGCRLDHSLSALRDRRVSFALRDLSLGGMSALSQAPMQPGERVGVFFPPQGSHRGWDAYGRVIRCEASATGYRVAVEFDPLPAA